MASGATASVKSGTPCKKVGVTEVGAALTYTCIKSGQKLVWDKGIKIPPKIAASDTESVSSVSLSVGCKNYKKSSDFAPYVVEWGICYFENTEVWVYQFANSSDKDSFFKTLQTFETTSGQLTNRDLWAIRGLFIFAPQDATKLKSLRAALGV